MATILIKKKDTAGVPGSGDLTNSTGGAEIAVNTSTKRLYTKNSGGTVVELGTNPATLQVNSAFTFPTSDGTNGQVLSTNGAGTVTWSTPSSGVSTISFGTTGLTPSTATSGAVTVSGTLAVANGGTGVTTSTGTGAVVRSSSPSLTTPNIGTPSAGNLTNCTADGTNKVGYRNIPAVGTKTGSYTLAVADIGKYVQVGSGGSITVPDATFAEGDVISIFNNTTGNITITCSITTAYIAGTDSDKASVTLATRGVATILFISSTVCVISGNVS